MSDKPFTQKLVAVLNERIETAKLMNALAHMSVGLGSAIGKENLRLSEYRDSLGGLHPFISEMPFIILTANSNKIRLLRQQASSAGILFADFTDTMTVGSYQEQILRTAELPEAELTYFGIVLFGEWGLVSELTKKFSLYKK